MKSLAAAAALVSVVAAAALADGLAAHADEWAVRTLVMLLFAGIATALCAAGTFAVARRRSPPVGRATSGLVLVAVLVQVAMLCWIGSVHVRALGFRALRAAYTLGMARDLPGWPPEAR